MIKLLLLKLNIILNKNILTEMIIFQMNSQIRPASVAMITIIHATLNQHCLQ